MFKLLVLAVSMIALAQSAALPVTGGIIEAGMDNNIMGNYFIFYFAREKWNFDFKKQLLFCRNCQMDHNNNATIFRNSR